jgi:hypothetical protein
MASSTRKAPAAIPAADFTPVFALSTAMAESFLQMQRLQLDAFMSWQKSFAANGQELYDEWACRFGGGAPIDG